VRAVDVEMALTRLAAAVDIMTASVDRMEGAIRAPSPAVGPLDLTGPVYKH
jgi:hypothetical protein